MNSIRGSAFLDFFFCRVVVVDEELLVVVIELLLLDVAEEEDSESSTFAAIFFCLSSFDLCTDGLSPASDGCWVFPSLGWTVVARPPVSADEGQGLLRNMACAEAEPPVAWIWEPLTAEAEPPGVSGPAVCHIAGLHSLVENSLWAVPHSTLGVDHLAEHQRRSYGSSSQCLCCPAALVGGRQRWQT